MENSRLLSSFLGVGLISAFASVAGSCGGSAAGSAGGGQGGGAATDAKMDVAPPGSGGAAGGSGGQAGGEIGGVPPGACTTIGSFTTRLPHVSASGAKATAVAQAVTAILAAQAPPVAVMAPYMIPTLFCRNNPSGGPVRETAGYTCTFQIQGVVGPPIAVKVDPPSTLAETLFKALADTGPAMCNQSDPRVTAVPHIGAENLSVSATEVQFDDSTMFIVPQVNVVAHGAEAQAVVAAFKQAGINDCDPTRKAFLICNKVGGAPSCGYQRLRLDMVGSSYLIRTCDPDTGSAVPGGGTGTTFPGGDISPAASAVLWQALLAAAQAGGFQPASGTFAETTIINARWFNWDGSTLRFFVLTGNVGAPPGVNGAPSN